MRRLLQKLQIFFLSVRKLCVHLCRQKEIKTLKNTKMENLETSKTPVNKDGKVIKKYKKFVTAINYMLLND